MQKIIFVFCILNSVIAMTMDAPLRRSSSSGRSGTLMARHQRHRSLGDKVSATLSIKNEEITDCTNNIDTLVTARRSTTSVVPQDSQTSTDSLARSNSRNLTGKAGEINRKNCALRIQLAFAAIKKIKAVNDAAHKEYLSHLKYAEHHLRSEMSLEITKDPQQLDSLVTIELQPLKDECANQMAFISGQKK